MDRITTSLLAEYSKVNGLSFLDEDKQFELFITYLVMSRFRPEAFEPAEIVTGNGSDTAVDAIGIIVNGALVTDAEEVADLAARNNYLDVTFVFIQVTRSPGFQAGKFGDISYGVCDFFKESPTLPRNDAVKERAAITAAIIQRSALFSKGNPECRIFYVTTGKWQGDQQLEARRQSAIDAVKDLDIFRMVEFTPIGHEDIHRLYRQTKNAITRQFTFASKVVIPETPGVTEAYLGLLSATEFLRLITDEGGLILKSIFYDNVRDWLGNNEVNQGIEATLGDESMRSRFALMNNGVTIIAKKLHPTGNRFLIEDYQIVNGCQTSHALFDQQKNLNDSVMIPIRLIVTNDDEVVTSIIKATNKQTEVKEEQFFALTEFGKKLESFFQSFPNGKKLYYERRARQYNALPIERSKVITLDSLIRAYISVFHEEPHRTTRSFGDVKATVGKSIFVKTDHPDPYYVSALALYRLEYLFRRTIDAKYKPARYQILMAFRLLADPTPIPRPNSGDMVKYCSRLMELLWNSEKAETIFTRAVQVVEDVAGGNFHRDNIRTLPFRDTLRAKCVALVRGGAGGRPDSPPATRPATQ